MWHTDRNGILPPRTPVGVLSGNDALSLLEVIEACVVAAEEADLCGVIWPKLEGLFDFRYAYASVASGPTADSDIRVRRFVNYNVPPEICIAYGECGWERDDQVVAEHFRSFRSQYWSGSSHIQIVLETGERRAIPLDNPCCAVLMDCGVRSGYLCGIAPTGPNELGSLICFSSSDGDSFDPRVEPILHHLLPHLHLALLRATRHEVLDDRLPSLSAREHEVLDWLKAGKSSWDISMVLGVSERTVNFHVYNLLHKLGAINRPQAVAIALRRGLISLD